MKIKKVCVTLLIGLVTCFGMASAISTTTRNVNQYRRNYSITYNNVQGMDVTIKGSSTTCTTAAIREDSGNTYMQASVFEYDDGILTQSDIMKKKVAYGGSISTADNTTSFVRDWDDTGIMYEHRVTIYQTTNSDYVNESTATRRFIVNVSQTN